MYFGVIGYLKIKSSGNLCDHSKLQVQNVSGVSCFEGSKQIPVLSLFKLNLFLDEYGSKIR